MKYVAVIRQVPEGEARLRIESGRVELSSTTMILDQMDEYGVEEAIRLREAYGGEVVVVAFGPERTKEAVRTALAMGADRAVMILQDGYIDPVSEARALAKVIGEEAPAVVLTGGQQADWDSQALGGALGEALGWPVVTWCTELTLEGDIHAKLKHDLDDGAEVVRVPLPVVVTTQQGLNEPRYPTLPNIMKAKRKEVREIPAGELGVTGSKVAILGQVVQERQRKKVSIDGTKEPADAAQELIRRLHEEVGAL